MAAELLDATKKSPPSFFERLVIDLLVAMGGYGGSAEEAGKVVGRGGDGGIDGIIKEDKLGLDAVYVQAKRWSGGGTAHRSSVCGKPGRSSGTQGVLITTSDFSSDDVDYVQKIEKKIVRVNGKQLAEFMIDYGIGATTEKIYTIRKIDADYFEEI